MTQIVNPTCEYRTNPLGIDVLVPRFSWQLGSDRRGARQAAYQILAASDPNLLTHKADLWDSGKRDADSSVLVPYEGPRLGSRRRVYWQVRVWDERGEVGESEPAWFELGLLERSDWQASWVGAALTGGARTTVPVPFLRKTFRLPGAVASARLYVTALGLYECSFNGETVGEDVFTPGWTDYRKRVQYGVYDVGDLLHEGDNALGAILGDGWAVGFVGLGGRQTYAERPRLLAQLEVTLQDGSRVTVVSDESWTHGFGPILESDLFMGEAYDARLEFPGWNTPAFDDRGWLSVNRFHDTGAALVATNGPTVQRIEELKPVGDPVDHSDLIRKRAILDLGQNMVGRVRFRGRASAGTTVVLRFAEVLDTDGGLYTANLRGARATDVYTFKGEGEEVWEPKFTFHGFRYVELSGYPGVVTQDTVTGVVIHSQMAQTGHFECSDRLLNGLQHNIVWGQKGNFVDVPTDCPQRDERLGWTGDIQVFARTAAFNMDVAGFMTKWARDVADAQTDAGCIPPVVPSVMSGFDDGGPAWADAAIICPWTMYLCYGDRRILEENYGVMARFMAFLEATSPGSIRCAPDYEGWRGFGDWLSINADTPRDLIGTALFAYDARLVADIAEILGREDDAQRYRTLFGEIRDAFGRRFLKGGEGVPTASAETRRDIGQADAISRGTLEVIDYGPVASEVFNGTFTPTQTAYVLALHFDILPEHLRPLAAGELVADIRRRNGHLSTGFVGAPYLPYVLSDNGELDTAFALLKQTSWPSWLYSVTQGATTIWERWDGLTEERGFQDPAMNSFNHYAYGSIGAWLYERVAGLEPDPEGPGYKHVYVRPNPGEGLTSARASLRSPYGYTEIAWRLEGEELHVDVTVPANTTATVTLPAGYRVTERDEAVSVTGTLSQSEGLLEIGSGRYRFKAEREALDNRP
jgi:alpha-L-rhamnosidase